jgi:uncharacterized protein (DUF302 family)
MSQLTALLLSLALLASQAHLACSAEASEVDFSSLVIIESAYDVSTTADRLEAAAAARGLTVFARIDHAAGATDAGMTLPPMELIIFGTAKVGTPLMQCDPTVGIDLPLKVLIWRDDNGRVMLGYSSSALLAARHDLGDCGPVLAKIDRTLAALATEVTGTSEEPDQK